MDGQMDRWMDGWMSVWMDRWMDKCMADGQTDGLMSGWMDRGREEGETADHEVLEGPFSLTRASRLEQCGAPKNRRWINNLAGPRSKPHGLLSGAPGSPVKTPTRRADNASRPTQAATAFATRTWGLDSAVLCKKSRAKSGAEEAATAGPLWRKVRGATKLRALAMHGGEGGTPGQQREARGPAAGRHFRKARVGVRGRVWKAGPDPSDSSVCSLGFGLG